MKRACFSLLLIAILAGCTLPVNTPAPTLPVEPAATTQPAAPEISTPTTAPQASEDLPTEPAEPTPLPLWENPEEAFLLVDGRTTEWADITPMAVDPVGDGNSEVDFTEFYVTRTADTLVIRIGFAAPIGLQSDNGITLLLETDQNPANGPELAYELGDRSGLFSHGQDTIQVGQGDLFLVSAPTITSDVFEIALPLDVRPDGEHPLFLTDTVGVWFMDTHSGQDQIPDSGIPVEFNLLQSPLPLVSPLSLDKPAGAFRIISYNIERDGLFNESRGPRFASIIQALQPDILSFQEVRNRSAESVLEWVQDLLGGEWYALKQRDLVTVSRYPFIEGWTDTYKPLDVRIFPLMLDVDGTPVLVFNAHLSCCRDDADRQEQADGFAAFLRDMPVEPGTPFMLAGDLNLVGEAQQLAALSSGEIQDTRTFGEGVLPDWDGTPLADLFPRHTHTPYTFTWFSRESSFSAGRLDYILFTDSVLQVVNHFILDTSELPEDVLEMYGLEAEDSRIASTHLPIVADFVLP
jgi:endonuclease/exonuclease/phosphatase family metal-dependent hydrolase